MVRNIKIFLTDLDGVLTDGGMYYSEDGTELRKFNTRDGMGFQLLKNEGIKTGIISSEDSIISKHRAKKLNVDYLSIGEFGIGKLEYVKEISAKSNIELSEIAYIGDDINCIELLKAVGISACPADANSKVKQIDNIFILKKRGGEGVVREFIDLLFDIGRI